jgi:hypothetical protein
MKDRIFFEGPDHDFWKSYPFLCKNVCLYFKLKRKFLFFFLRFFGFWFFGGPEK